jgi:predicted SAM-dependent methyltransferase
MSFQSETEKIRPKVMKWLDGFVFDIGCGHDKVKPAAVGIDCRPLPGVDRVTNRLNSISVDMAEYRGIADAVYSSHCLEHFQDDVGAIKDWSRLIKVGGYLVLYLPEISLYTVNNPEHLHEYKYEEFVSTFMAQFENLKVEDHGLDSGYDRYSFWIVAKRVS